MRAFQPLALLLSATVSAQLLPLALVPVSIRDARTEEAMLIPPASKPRSPRSDWAQVRDWTLVTILVNDASGLLSTASHDAVLFVDRAQCRLVWSKGRLVCAVPRLEDPKNSVLWRPPSEWARQSGKPLLESEIDALRAAAEKDGRGFKIGAARRATALEANNAGALFDLIRTMD